MAADKPTVIDGFTSVQAVRRTGKGSSVARTRPSRTKLPATQTDKRKKKPPVTRATRIGHTVMPAKYEIVCYECEYAFTVQGRIQNSTFCPKCRKRLRYSDHVVDSVWTEDLKTIGTIEVKPEGVIRNADLVAREIILAGRIENSRVRVTCRLEICSGAKIDLRTVELRNLLIRAGAQFSIRRKLVCNNLEVAGTLRSRAFVEEQAVIKRGGHLLGEIHSPSLIVEEGGGLSADVSIGSREKSRQ